FGWKKTKTKFMAWRKTTTVKRRSCGEGGAEAEVEALKRRWRRGRLVSVKLSVGFTYSPPSQI
ncbi:hypothetical protein HID58_095185, partial [Brassica napus]